MPQVTVHEGLLNIESSGRPTQHWQFRKAYSTCLVNVQLFRSM